MNNGSYSYELTPTPAGKVGGGVTAWLAGPLIAWCHERSRVVVCVTALRGGVVKSLAGADWSLW